MPIFDFQAPDGTVHSIEGPEGATREQAWSKLQEHLASDNPQDTGQTGSTVSGTLKAIPSGAVRGLAATAGMATDAVKYLYGNKDEGPNPIGSEALQAKVAPYIHQPQGPAEEIADRIGQNLPFAAIGPEGLAARVGYNAVLPAVAGYAAEKATGSPLAAGAAALATPLAARGIVGGLSALRNGAGAAEQELGDWATAHRMAAGAKFDAARDMGVQATPQGIDAVVGDMRNQIKGYPQGNPVLGEIDRMEKLAQGTRLPNGQMIRPAVDMNDVEDVRQAISKLRQSPDNSIRGAAQEAHDALTKWQMNLDPAHVAAGDGALYSQTMKDAVRQWGEGRRGEIIAGKVNLADLKTANKGSGADADNTTRQVFTALAKPINNTNVPVWKKMGFSNEQGAIIESIAKGSPYGNFMRAFGKFAPTGAVSAGTALGLGELFGGHVGAFALPAVGAVAKTLGDMDTRSRVKALDSLIRSGSKIGPAVAQQLGPEVVSQLPKGTQNMLNARNAFNAAKAGKRAYRQAAQDQKKP